MSRDLNEAHVRFLNAESVGVTTQWISWPEYTTFTENLISYSKLADGAALDPKTRGERDRYWDLRRVLRGTPIHPSEYFDSSTPVADVELNSELGKSLSRLRESVKVLCATENPMRIEMLRHFAGNPSLASSSDNKAYLLVSNKSVSKVNEILLAESFNSNLVQAMKLNQARKIEAAEIMFIFGAPENHANYFKKGIEKSREVAWLFNSPAARKILIYQLADCPSFDSSLYEIWPGSNQFQSKSVGEKPPAFIESFEPIVGIDPIHEPPSVPGDPVVDAVVVHLFNGRYIYYSEAVPPKPTCVRSGELEVEIDDDVRASALQPGDVLLIRTGAASHTFLRSHAKVWLVEKYGDLATEKMFEIADTYKKSLQTKYDDLGFIRQLVNGGMEEGYIRNQILRSFVGSTIATQKPENFIQIAQALGLNYGQESWSAIINLQTAHRQAGHAASQELREIVREDDSWQDVVNEPGIAKLKAGSIGEMVLIPVVQKPDQIIRVSVSSLGQLHHKPVLFHG